MGSDISKQIVDAAPNITTSLAVERPMIETASPSLLDLPPELFDMVSNYLDKDSDFLKLRILSKESKMKARNTFRKKFASRLAHVDGSLSRSHLATLLALVTDDDTAAEIETISITPDTMSEAVLNWPELPESFKDRLRAHMQAELLDLDEGAQMLTKVFSSTPHLPKLQYINIGTHTGSNSMPEPDVPEKEPGQVSHNIATSVKHLVFTHSIPETYSSDPGHRWPIIVDKFSRQDLTLVATLMALTHVRHYIKSQNIVIQVILRDIAVVDLWYRSATRDEVEWMSKRDFHDPMFYSSTISHMAKASVDLLAKLREHSLEISGSPDTAIELVRDLAVRGWTSNPQAILGISALAKQILYHGRHIKQLVTNFISKDPCCAPCCEDYLHSAILSLTASNSPATRGRKSSRFSAVSNISMS